MKLLRKIFNRFRKKAPTDEEITRYIVGKIRAGGGEVGENIDLIATSIDLGEPYLIKIGNNVTMSGVKLLTHDSCLYKTTGYTRVGKVHIGSDVFIGWGTIILPGVTIGDRVVIGAGSVVTKDIPENSVAVGNPCRVVGGYDELVKKSRLAMENGVVTDKKPSEIMQDAELIARLVDAGGGYIG